MDRCLARWSAPRKPTNDYWSSTGTTSSENGGLVRCHSRVRLAALNEIANQCLRLSVIEKTLCDRVTYSITITSPRPTKRNISEAAHYMEKVSSDFTRRTRAFDINFRILRNARLLDQVDETGACKWLLLGNRHAKSAPVRTVGKVAFFAASLR